MKNLILILLRPVHFALLATVEPDELDVDACEDDDDDVLVEDEDVLVEDEDVFVEDDDVFVEDDDEDVFVEDVVVFVDEVEEDDDGFGDDEDNDDWVLLIDADELDVEIVPELVELDPDPELVELDPDTKFEDDDEEIVEKLGLSVIKHEIRPGALILNGWPVKFFKKQAWPFGLNPLQYVKPLHCW